MKPFRIIFWDGNDDTIKGESLTIEAETYADATGIAREILFIVPGAVDYTMLEDRGPEPFEPFWMIKGDAHTPQSMWDVILCINAEQEKDLREKGFVKANFQERY